MRTLECDRPIAPEDRRGPPRTAEDHLVNFLDATTNYQLWLAQHCAFDQPDWLDKLDKMRSNAFAFLRGTYYRWLSHWSTRSATLREAPNVLAVGDLHVENFGTWRDAEGRLVWGINDFDDADDLPYTIDLIRLATSLRLADIPSVPPVKFSKVCRWILEAYQESWQSGGEPFVLEERHPTLRALAMAEEREPAKFWQKLTNPAQHPPVEPPEDVQRALRETLPDHSLTVEYRRREKSGVGSLGKPRYLLLCRWCGSWIAREAKALTPPTSNWFQHASRSSRVSEILQRAVRCPDPYFRVSNNWLIRRLAPRSSRIELKDLKRLDDARELLQAMGYETANIHQGTPHAREAVLADLAARPDGWLFEAAEEMAAITQQEWTNWRHGSG